MTDKEQIICAYKFQDKEKFSGKPYCTCFNELCEDLSFVCDHNCQIYEDYKQLARKTQECEQLKEKNNNLRQMYESMAELCGIKDEAIIDKQADIEELKEENQKLQMQLCNECGERDDYNIPCKMIRDLDYGLQKEIEKNECYHKALKEIEKVCLEDTYTFADGAQIRYDSLDDILNIINKTKG